MSFEFLGLSDEILSAVTAAGYSEPTPIQKQAIPSILMGRDVLGIAQTGTGKTAGFTLPMIDILAEGRAKARIPRSLIVEPTRELAVQIQESFEKYGKNHKLGCALLIGGTSMADQIKALNKSVDVLIATPGRLLDHFERGNVMLNGIEILVIDEADRMLDMGFIPDVERIRKLILGKPQTLFFSATMPPAIKKLTDAFLDDPKSIQVSSPSRTADTVEQNYIKVSRRDKTKTLQKVLEKAHVTSAIIFCNRKKDVTAVYKAMHSAGLNARELHGDMDQSSRLEVLNMFKSGDLDYLIASDVAARGLDIKDVSHVINYDVPIAVEDYIHRIGRTGRAGKKGHAILLMDPKERDLVEKIERVAKCKILPLGDDKPDKGTKPAKDVKPAKDAKPANQSWLAKDTKPAKQSESVKKAEPVKNVEPAKKPDPVKEAKSTDNNSGKTSWREAAKKQDANKAGKPAEKKAETKPEQKAETKPEQKAETKPDQKAETRPDRRHDNRPGKKKPRIHQNGVQEMDDHDGPGLGAHVPAFLMQTAPKK